MLPRMGTLALPLALATHALTAVATPSDGVLDPCTPAPVTGAENEVFKDVLPGSVGSAEANALFAEGVTKGCSASPQLFCPTCEISRAALITLVVRAATLPLVSPTTPTFSDVPASHPFYKEIETAHDAGIASGCVAGQFCPDAPATRAQAAIFVAEAAGFPLTAPATPSFTDVPASHLAYPHVEALKTHCVTTGCTATEFCPGTEMLRAQAAVFVAKAFDLGNTNPCLPAADAGADAGGDATGGGGGGSWNDASISPVDGGGGGSGKPGSTDGDGDDGGCGCATPARSSGAALGLGLAVFAALLGRRRRL